jgi:hypothetical protein
MSDFPIWQLLADGVLLLHIVIVFGVILGLALIVLGNLLRWRWVNALWLRLLHLATIAVVVAEAWFGITCPLTTLEMYWRAKARGPTYGGGFMEHWMRGLLFYQAPAWVFTLSYTLFGLAVVATWWWWPPHWPGRDGPRRAG